MYSMFPIHDCELGDSTALRSKKCYFPGLDAHALLHAYSNGLCVPPEFRLPMADLSQRLLSSKFELSRSQRPLAWVTGSVENLSLPSKVPGPEDWPGIELTINAKSCRIPPDTTIPITIPISLLSSEEGVRWLQLNQLGECEVKPGRIDPNWQVQPYSELEGSAIVFFRHSDPDYSERFDKDRLVSKAPTESQSFQSAVLGMTKMLAGRE